MMNANIRQAREHTSKLKGLMYAFSAAFIGGGPLKDLEVLDYAENSFDALVEMVDVISGDLDRLMNDEEICRSLGFLDDGLLNERIVAKRAGKELD